MWYRNFLKKLLIFGVLFKKDVDTDVTLSEDSDLKLASQHAIKTYVDTFSYPKNIDGGAAPTIVQGLELYGGTSSDIFIEEVDGGGA